MPMPPFPPQAVPYASIGDPNVDASHLTVLSICHYVWAGMLALFSCFGIMYIVIGVLAINGKLDGGRATIQTVPVVVPGTPPTTPVPVFAQPMAPSDAWFGYIFIGLGAFITLGGWSVALCTAIAGRSIATRRRRVFVIVVAIVNCIIVPLGTVLAVFTLVVIFRDSVRQAFDDAARGRAALA